MDIWRFKKFPKIFGIVTVLLLWLPAMSLQAATQSHSFKHVFSIDDVQGSFNDDRYQDNPDILCDAPGSPACPGDTPPLVSGPNTLYPIDSVFGFEVVDFVGAAQKTLDGIYTEGYAGNYTVGSGGATGVDQFGNPVDESTDTAAWPALTGGLMVSSPETAVFKTPAKLGTWCAGLGGATVKCDSEHFVVMEHALSCHETIPYLYADENGTQLDLVDPETSAVVANCADAKLDNQLYVVENGAVSGTPLGNDNGVPDLIPNESSVRKDIAVSDDYSMTKKDDGKPLYRWGNVMKRPTDIRVYAKLDLPAEWKQGNVYNVTKAELRVRHWITNSPNDQIRAEDMENEGASGVIPEYVVDGNGDWRAARDCWESDGDPVDGSSGTLTDRTLYRDVAQTYYDPTADNPGSTGDPIAFSEDLNEGFTNAWYTTLDREPFEWWYKNASGEYRSFASPELAAADPDFANLTLQSGPRWRLKAPKFGQDNPSVEIGVDKTSVVPSGVPGCQEPPVSHQQVKYARGDLTVTTLNLLDWEDANGPLLTTAGWVDARANVNAIISDGSGEEVHPETATGISVNGAPLTEDFDLVVYVKGDKKPTVIYDAELYVEWDDTPVATVSTIEGVGDFNPVSMDDLLLRSGTALSFMEANGATNSIRTLDLNWTIEGVGDFNGDNSADVLVRDGTNVSYVNADGSPAFIRTLGANWEIVGVGDFDGDSASDVLVRDGTTVSYFTAGNVSTYIRSLGADWSIVAVGNFTGDAASEIMVRNGTKIAYFTTANVTTFVRSLDLDWSIEGVGNFDGLTTDDVLVRNGANVSYFDAIGAASWIANLDAEWVIEGVGNLGGDAVSEIVIRNGGGIGAEVEYMDVNGATTSITSSL